MKKKLLITMASFFVIMFSFSQSTSTYDSFALPIKIKPGAQLSKSVNSDISPNRLVTCERPDVRIFPSNVPQSEVHISINRVNNQSLLVSSNTFPIGNSFQGAYWSNNSGVNWQGADILPNNAFGRGDPSTTYDALGRGYIASMAPNAVAPPNGLLIQRTDNNGAVWQPQVNGTGVINGFDKDMIAADDVTTSPFANNLYCTWTVFGGATTVQFNRSTNGGNAFTAPIILKNGFGQGANVQTGPNGEVYVCWADYTNGAIPAQGLGFTRSLNGGVTFTPFTIPFNYAGIRVGNGPNPDFNNTRVNDFPSMAVDKSNSPRRGRIYVVYAERENGNGRSIIRLRWSDNRGDNWSAPTTVSVPNVRQSWMPWISVDNTNGNVYVTYFCMENLANFNTNTFVAASIDGFTTFQNRIVSDVAHVTAPIDQFQNGYAGDYIGITANNGRGFAAWMDNRNGTWQNYISEVRVADINLTGGAALCSGTNTYTLTGVPNGATVNWQTPTPAGIVNIAPNGTTATLSRQGTARGVVTLSAEIIAGGCSYGIFSIQINVGVPNTNYKLFTIQTLTTLCGWDVTLSNFCNATGFVWQDLTPLPYTQELGQTQLYHHLVQENVDYGPITLNYTIAAVNQCGTGNFITKSVNVPAPWRTGNCNIPAIVAPPNYDSKVIIQVSPNPTTNSITATKNDDGGFNEIRIFDKLGTLRKQIKYPKNTKSATINLNGLATDIYRLQAFDGVNWSTISFSKL